MLQIVLRSATHVEMLVKPAECRTDTATADVRTDTGEIPVKMNAIARPVTASPVVLLLVSLIKNSNAYSFKFYFSMQDSQI